MNIQKKIQGLTKRVARASRTVYTVPEKTRNGALKKAAVMLIGQMEKIIRANKKDLAAGKRAGRPAAFLDKLTLTPARIREMVKGLREVAAQKDPVGNEFDRRIRPNGLRVKKVRVPIGTILIIYESRPNVTIDAAALCLKAGNAVILRGGREAFFSNKVLVNLFQKAAQKAGLPKDCVGFVDMTDRKAIEILLRQSADIDMVIPRGGEGLIRMVTENSHIPVLKHYKGVCTVYVDRQADLNMAERIAVNAKVQRPGVCNAMETLLLDKGVGKKGINRVIKALTERGVKVLGDGPTRAVVRGLTPARTDDYYREFLDLTLAVKLVDGVDAAIQHISHFSSHHTDTIVTRNKKTAKKFLAEVDSASVMWNASTRFADGGEYGLGAEIGISTDKLHARGPMGAFDLTTYKWVVEGSGQIRK